jgi:hypothetical protein
MDPVDRCELISSSIAEPETYPNAATVPVPYPTENITYLHGNCVSLQLFEHTKNSLTCQNIN